jgi:starch phosphorylase
MSAKKKIVSAAKKDFTLKLDADALAKSFAYNLQFTMGKDPMFATAHDNFMALSYAVKDRLTERWIATQRRYHHENGKRVYYLSLEFLIGRLLGNNVINLCAYDETRAALKKVGVDIEDIRDNEVDAGLGNGGLGRLAACFLDSMATLGIAAHGYGIRYDFGIFNQKIVHGQQVESPDE